MVQTTTPFVLRRRVIRDQAVEMLPPFRHDGNVLIGAPLETVYRHAGKRVDV